MRFYPLGKIISIARNDKGNKKMFVGFHIPKNIANFDYFHEAFSKTSYFISEECTSN